RYGYNHWEAGHGLGAKPTDPFKRGWAKTLWKKLEGQLVDQGPGTSPKLVLPPLEPDMVTRLDVDD
ncbi:hypothetical protein, partial [Ramlibacter alkalitolerans]